MKWTRREAVALTKKLQEYTIPFNLSVALTGSVLYNGKSDKDLDIILFPYKNPGPEQHAQFFEFIRKKREIYVVFCVNHREMKDSKLVYLCNYFNKKGDKKRIDFILPHLVIEDRMPNCRMVRREA